MNYKEFRASYKATLKKYPDIDTLFCFLDSKVITETITHYTKKGGRWIETETKEALIPARYYYNVLDAVPFFKNLGGYERIETKYTKHGLIPVRVTSINPSRDEKTVRSYKF